MVGNPIGKRRWKVGYHIKAELYYGMFVVHYVCLLTNISPQSNVRKSASSLTLQDTLIS